MLRLNLGKTFVKASTRFRHTESKPAPISEIAIAHKKTDMTSSHNTNGLFSGALEKSTAFLSVVRRHMGLRDRYLVTRSGHLRLRYMAMPVALAVVVFPMMFSGASAIPSAADLNQIATAAGAEMIDAEMNRVANAPNDDSFASRLNNNLYGQLSLASVMSRTMPTPTDKIVTVESGDALGTVMERAGVDAADTTEVVTAMKAHFDPRSLKAGQDIHMHFEPSEEGGMKFVNMKMKMDTLKTLVVSRGDAGFTSAIEEKEVVRRVKAQGAKIEVSLYGSAAKAGIPQSVVADAIRIYSQNVDFQRDIRQGDALEVMYDAYETEDGDLAKTGDILFAKLTLGGKDIQLFRYAMADGRIDYFTPDGKSSRRTLMTTPIDGARMSSGFGMRRHPVLGYSKMHKGVDFAAPTGTPIYASGDGVVEKAGRFSSYGNYVRVRHGNGISTAYAHMSRIKAKAGARVRQGEIIGYVGTTGRSTGPHLHYEVTVNGKHVNPRSVNLPTGENLTGKELKKFKDSIRGIEQEYASLSQGVKVAMNDLFKRSSTKDVN